MADTIRIKRRAAGGAAGAPAALANAELAYNEQDDTLYYGKGGTSSAAASIISIGGPGAFPSKTYVDNADALRLLKAGDTMTGPLVLPADPTTALQAATKQYVDAHAGAGGIADDSVTNAKLANMTAPAFKGRTTTGAGDPEDLTGTQATAMLDLFTSALKGLAPPSGGGTANFLRADGAWTTPAGGGGSATISIGATPPASPAVGAMWWDNIAGQLYLYYDDGTSQQWVVVTNQPIGLGNAAVNATAPTLPTVGQLWFDTVSGQLFIWYDDGTSQQWVSTTGLG
jgi:hypothetical protein